MLVKLAFYAPSNSRFTPGGVFVTGHIPQVKVQVIMLQINNQDLMCLLALIIIQNMLFGPLKADLHGTTLSRAINLRQVYDMNRFV